MTSGDTASGGAPHRPQNDAPGPPSAGDDMEVRLQLVRQAAIAMYAATEEAELAYHCAERAAGSDRQEWFALLCEHVWVIRRAVAVAAASMTAGAGRRGERGERGKTPAAGGAPADPAAGPGGAALATSGAPAPSASAAATEPPGPAAPAAPAAPADDKRLLFARYLVQTGRIAG